MRHDVDFPRARLSARGAAGAAGAFDTFLNVQISLVLALQMALCLACALVSLWWRGSAGFSRYYLALNSYNEGGRRAAPRPAPAHKLDASDGLSDDDSPPHMASVCKGQEASWEACSTAGRSA